MAHQINLLQLPAGARGPWLSLLAVVATALVSAAVMAGLSWQATSETRHLRGRVAQLEQQARDRAAQEMGTAQVQLIGDLEHRLAQRKALLADLQGALQHDRPGYADWFRALAHASTDGTWLVAAEVDRQGATLHGRALSAERVPAYLGHLEAEPMFAGKAFNTIEVDVGQDRTLTPATGEGGQFADALSFTLSTHDAAGADRLNAPGTSRPASTGAGQTTPAAGDPHG